MAVTRVEKDLRAGCFSKLNREGLPMAHGTETFVQQYDRRKTLSRRINSRGFEPVAVDKKAVREGLGDAQCRMPAGVILSRKGESRTGESRSD